MSWVLLIRFEFLPWPKHRMFDINKKELVRLVMY